MSLEGLLELLNREVGDVRPGPERDKKIDEVIGRYLARAMSKIERSFWTAMLSDEARAELKKRCRIRT